MLCHKRSRYSVYIEPGAAGDGKTGRKKDVDVGMDVGLSC